MQETGRSCSEDLQALCFLFSPLFIVRSMAIKVSWCFTICVGFFCAFVVVTLKGKFMHDNYPSELNRTAVCIIADLHKINAGPHNTIFEANGSYSCFWLLQFENEVPGYDGGMS